MRIRLCICLDASNQQKCSVSFVDWLDPSIAPHVVSQRSCVINLTVARFYRKQTSPRPPRRWPTGGREPEGSMQANASVNAYDYCIPDQALEELWQELGKLCKVYHFRPTFPPKSSTSTCSGWPANAAGRFLELRPVPCSFGFFSGICHLEVPLSHWPRNTSRRLPRLRSCPSRSLCEWSTR